MSLGVINHGMSYSTVRDIGDNRPVYYYVFAVFTTILYRKLHPTFEPDYSTLE
jgi:hypothetical protein